MSNIPNQTPPLRQLENREGETYWRTFHHEGLQLFLQTKAAGKTVLQNAHLALSEIGSGFLYFNDFGEWCDLRKV